ncbi:MAG: tetratricopeptide repeat protein [Caldimonas sp.]
MSTMDPRWEERLASLWASLPECDPESFRGSIRSIVAELPEGSAVGLFELGCAQDSTGHSDRAVPLYEAALRAGLSGVRRRRATIQLASSLRNGGRAQEAAALLEEESRRPDDELSGAVSAFRALALSDLGRDHEALGHALSALSHCLPRYNQSLARYAAALLHDGAHDADA